MLAAGLLVVAELDHRLELGSVAPVLFLERLLVDGQIIGFDRRIDEPGAAGALTGHVVAFELTAPHELGNGAAHLHAVFQIQRLGEFVDGEEDSLVSRSGKPPHHRIETADDVGAGVVAVDEKFLRAGVGEVEHQFALRGFTVAPGASRLLVIGLDAAGHVEVGDKAHVGAVDSHAEGVRRHDHVVAAVEKDILRPFPVLVLHPAVVGDEFHAHAGKGGADFLDLFPRRAIDDAGAVRLDEVLEPRVFLAVAFAMSHSQAEVRSLEAADRDVGIAQLQHLENVIAHLGRGGGGEGGGLGMIEHLEGLGEAQVVRPEIVTPLAETVRLIDRDEGDGHALERANEGAAAESLRRDVDELEFPRAHLAEPLGLLGGREGAVDHRRGHAFADEPIDLVFHQGDEWADDEGDALHHHRGQLITERLPAACRHHREGVPSGEEGGDDGLLPGEEFTKTKMPLQRRDGIAEELLVGGEGGHGDRSVNAGMWHGLPAHAFGGCNAELSNLLHRFSKAKDESPQSGEWGASRSIVASGRMGWKPMPQLEEWGS